MAKPKKKLLPKDFAEQLKIGDLESLKAVFTACDVNARGGYSKETALAFNDCPDELARWLVANGADLEADDTYKRTPLHARAGSKRGNIAVLIELGSDLEKRDSTGNTPLHSAARFHSVASAQVLIKSGAQVGTQNQDGLTPLDLALQTCNNIDIEMMVPLARVLLGAGAQPSSATAGFVSEIGKRFEFSREGFNPDYLKAASDGLDDLYALFQVTPVPRRVIHNGTSPITVSSTTWQQQHFELWQRMVPSSGAAQTVQGEVIRISGRISREIVGNGGANWDADYKAMARAFLEFVRTGNRLEAKEDRDAEAIVESLLTRRDGDTDRMVELAVNWVLRNRIPVPTGNVGYQR